MKKVILILAATAIFISCNKDVKEVSEPLDIKIQTINKAAKFEVKQEDLASFELYKSMSMNQLVAEYQKDRSNKAIPKFLVISHEIPVTQYLLMRYAFWKNYSTIYIQTYQKDKIDEIRQYPEEYIRFNPTNKHVASDISYDRIMRGSFNPTTTCYPIAMFEEIHSRMAETDYVKIVKGFNYIYMGGNKYEPHTTVLLEVMRNDNTTLACYDISHDPD